MKKLVLAAAALLSFAANAQYVDANTAAYMRAQQEMRDINNADSARRAANALQDMARNGATIHNPNR